MTSKGYRSGAMEWRNLATRKVDSARGRVGPIIVADDRIVVGNIRFLDLTQPCRYEIDRKRGEGRWYCSDGRSDKLTGYSWDPDAEELSGVHIEFTLSDLDVRERDHVPGGSFRRR